MIGGCYNLLNFRKGITINLVKIITRLIIRNYMHCEKCGVFAICGQYDEGIGLKLFNGLSALQHRGQESAGVAIFSKETKLIKHYGLVKDVFVNYDNLAKFSGRMALGHVCYGQDRVIDNEIQPYVINSPKGQIYIAYNGCITNYKELVSHLPIFAKESNDNVTDIECIGKVFVNELLNGKDILVTLKLLLNTLKGAFCLIFIINETIFCIRDKYGFRPMCYGRTELGQYIFASESCALDAIGATFVREIRPGEIIFTNGTNITSNIENCEKAPYSFCSFEYLYFANKKSIINDNLVAKIRYDSGKILAMKSPISCDLVIGVPDSGIDAAKGFAKELGIPYKEGFVRNKKIQRTFIVPNQKKRQNLVQKKLTVIKEVVKDKEIVVVDDSIVRGTTVKQIVKLLRKAGAKKIHMRISSPKFIYSCPYGTDIGEKETLIAYNRTTEEISKIIGVDSLAYLETKDIDILVGRGYSTICKACFNGKYPDE